MATADLIAPFPTDIDREAFGHWLSGFTDGEGSFGLRVASTRQGRCISHIASLRIATRADDGDVLRLIQSYWQCGICIYNENVRSKIRNAKPVLIYGVYKADDLAKIIIPHFDRYPMRAKKANEFAIWRQGVTLMATVQSRALVYRPGRAPNRHGGTFPKWTRVERERFHGLANSLKKQRVYATTPETYIDSPTMHQPKRTSLFDGVC